MSNHEIKALNMISNKKKLSNFKFKHNCFIKDNRYPLYSKKLFFNFNGYWDFVLYTKDKQLSLYVYSNIYYFRLAIPNNISRVNFNKNTSILSLENLYPNNFYNMYWSYLNHIFSTLNKPFFVKLKFKGKGYYIYKNKRNTITPQFGYAHRIYLYAYFLTVKFLSKTSIIVFGFSKDDVFKTSKAIKNMRPINIFTGRGVRFSREIIYRKQGKVSSYR